MPNQQLKFALIFIALGAILGWFGNEAFNQNRSKSIENNAITSVDTLSNVKKNTSKQSVLSKSEQTEKQFIQLLKNVQYEDALILYQLDEINNEKLLLPHLLLKIVELTEQLEPKVFNLLDTFLQEYYNNSNILVSQAKALIAFGKKDQAFDSLFLAKNYARNNQEYIEINQKIYDLSFKTFEQIKLKNEWQQGVHLFSILIENDPQFPFYHLAIAKSYMNIGERESAIPHLQLISQDTTYGKQASEMLEIALLSETSNTINLEVEEQHYIVTTTLADSYQVKLIIDTGASYSSLSSYTIAQLVNDNLAEKIDRKEVNTAGGKISVDIYKVQKMSLGVFSVGNIDVAEIDLETSSNKNVDGLLGVNFLNQFDFSIDQKNKQLMLSPKH
ncbi:MAG: retroviral-like aspartic protease family protein [Gammaproteobacteria bacterium]|nr:retroviral-like aspartic protease family protein [Gammaproteobacteria bacterium]